ncbi:MAG TPA: hypothetical protein VF571_16805 [Pyrinomonadaceae bacterium]|jgi:hypothetical protein
MRHKNSQSVLNFACDTCSWKVSKLCNGATNGKSYLLQGENYIGCFDVAKRESFFFDTFKTKIPIPKSSHQNRLNLPPYTLTVNRGMTIPNCLENFVFGISLGKIIGKRGYLRYKDVNEIKLKFGIPMKARVALIGTGDDKQLEIFWKIHQANQVFEKIARMGFDWVTSLTWSVWEEDFPRPDQIRNQQRNFQSYDLFANLGVPCIPFLFLIDEIDFENTNQWLQERPDINTVAIYARYYRDSNTIFKLLKYLEKIQEYVKRPLEFLIVGIAKADNISLLKKKFNVKFVNGKPYYATVKGGRLCNSKLEYSKSDLPKEEVLRINFLRNYGFCKKVELSK